MILNAASDGPGRRRLSHLGLRVEQIHDALRCGVAERATYSDLDANGIGEAARWSRHVRRMSEQLLGEDWMRLEIDNQPTLIHPDQKWSLVVASGSAGCGDPNYRPTTKNPKGKSIRDAVRANGELALFTPQSVKPELEGLRETWMLLTYASDTVLNAEVSLACPPKWTEPSSPGGRTASSCLRSTSVAATRTTARRSHRTTTSLFTESEGRI